MKLVNPVSFTMRTGDILAAADVLTNTTNFVEIGRWKGLVGEVMDMGYGPYDKINEAIGRCLIELVDTAAANLEGIVRLERHDPQDNFVDKVFEESAAALRNGGGATPNILVQKPFPQQKKGIKRDSYFVLMFKADVAAKTLDISASNAAINCTRFKAIENI